MDTHNTICFLISIRKGNELSFARYMAVWTSLALRLPVQKPSKLPSRGVCHQIKLTGKQIAVSVSICTRVESLSSIRKE
jgi:hypothetical protein